MLIGNLTRDPELRYTPQGTAVCTIGIATNRSWTTDAGDKREETEFHRLVSWNKLAELCGQLLAKGRKVFVEGRLQTRSWTGQDGAQRTTTEIVIDDMILLDSRRPIVPVSGVPGVTPVVATAVVTTPITPPTKVEVSAPIAATPQATPTLPTDDKTDDKKKKKKADEEAEKKEDNKEIKVSDEDSKPKEEVNADDIPF